MTEMTGTDTRPRTFRGLRHRAPLHEQRSDSPQGPAHLVFYRLKSLFRPRSIHSPAHQVIPLLGIAPPSCMCANTPAFSPLLFYSERIHDLKFPLPVNVHPPQPLRRHSVH
jgi:hypothetical protein